MSRVIFTLTDDDVRSTVLDEIRECEEEGWIAFPGADERDEFVNECVETVIYRVESYLEELAMHNLFSGNDVLDLAKDYGYDTAPES